MAAFLGGQKKRFILQIWILKGRIERPFLRLEINQIAKEKMIRKNQTEENF